MRMRREDFDAAMAKHARRVFTLAVYLLGDREEAEDVTQEVLIRLWRRGHEVDISLEGAMLEVVAGAMEQQSPDLAEMVSQLERVRVMVGAPEGADGAAVTANFNAAVSRLETSDWKRIVSVEEDDEQVYIYAREIEEAIAGLTVLVNDSAEEIVVVNIVGNIDPRVLGRLIANMDEMPDLDDLMDMAE